MKAVRAEVIKFGRVFLDKSCLYCRDEWTLHHMCRVFGTYICC